jgi:alpha-beta hydrolase superfamily lysophospholipase
MKTILRIFIVIITASIVTISCKTEVNTEVTINQPKKELIQHTVDSDGHPMAVWKKGTKNSKGIILFVHGRTWSAVPDFDLQVAGEDLSLMDGMVAKGYTTYAVDLRGYGETPRDRTEWLTPNIAAKDIQNVLRWISKQHQNKKVHLFGWSMGSTSSLLATQQNSEDIASLTLFGFWKNLDYKIPTRKKSPVLRKTVNTAKNAASDFIVPGSISKKAVATYVKMALESDPIKVDWKNMNEFNDIDPSLIVTPTLILQGEFDPIGPTDIQAKLFTRLKTADKSWSVISGGDHAAFMETPRTAFISVFEAFIKRFNK